MFKIILRICNYNFFLFNILSNEEIISYVQLPTLWGSFEIRNQRLAKIMLQQFAKEPVHHNLDLFDNLANQFEKLPLYFLTFHGPQPLNMVMDVSFIL